MFFFIYKVRCELNIVFKMYLICIIYLNDCKCTDKGYVSMICEFLLNLNYGVTFVSFLP